MSLTTLRARLERLEGRRDFARLSDAELIALPRTTFAAEFRHMTDEQLSTELEAHMTTLSRELTAPQIKACALTTELFRLYEARA